MTSERHALERIAQDGQHTVRERAHALLTAHQRHGAGCLCGWAGLGKSHAAHQADELARVGLLIAADHRARLGAGTEDG